ncbi:hypothetical protein [Sporolactobacillus vineae]|uniref:hypothetical protein n=1 Tax=Sporolactobacillus vineae TaxID=444463 RepID=UPI00035E385B|nr:hypothetical protein [Sporolactobacillus vineae]
MGSGIQLEHKLRFYFLYLFVLLAGISGVFGFVSQLWDFPVIKLWKEIYITLFFFLVFSNRLIKSGLNNPTNKSVTRFLLIAFIYFILEGFYSISLPIKLILYQYKMDVPLLIFFMICWIILAEISEYNLKKISKLYIRILLSVGILNALAIILERVFSAPFLRLLGIQGGNWGTTSGVKVITMGSQIRAIGLLSNFVASGTLMLMCIIILIETQTFLDLKNKLVLYTLIILFAVSLFLTTYKTAVMGLIFYCTLKIIEKFKKKYIIHAFSLFVFFLFFISTHFYSIYYFASMFNRTMAYNSIYLRVVQHISIISQLNTIPKVLFGLGMGRNGIYGINKMGYGINPIATDSTYIYLVSNYGYLAVLLFLLFGVWIIRLFFLNSEKDVLGARFLLLYTVCLEFFYNNFFSDFPTNMFLILLCILSFFIYKRTDSLK